MKKFDHVAHPVWSKFYSRLVCLECKQPVAGDGTINNRWRHVGECVHWDGISKFDACYICGVGDLDSSG